MQQPTNGLDRTDKRRSLREAAGLVKNGMTLALGGFNTANKPMALVREIIKQGIKDLTVVAPPSSIDVDILIGAGCVKTLMAPYVGAEVLAPVGPFFRHAAQEGAIDIREVDAGIILTMLKAARQGLPFLPWKGGVGTSLPELNPDLKIMECPFTGEKLLAVPAANIDVAFIHAARSDPYGNVQHLGDKFADALIAHASRLRIVQVEQIVENEEIRRTHDQTSISSIFVDVVVHVPYGAHPFFSQKHYIIDKEHIREYLAAAKAYLEGDKGPFARYMDRYVYSPQTQDEYLAQVGIGRLLDLGAQESFG